MWYLLTLLVFAYSTALEPGCFIHRFDEHFKEIFNYESGICGAMLPWIQESFNDVDIEPFHPYSGSFVRPETTHSCIYSINFGMAKSGRLQLNVYMYLRSTLDQIRILAYQIEDPGNNVQVGEFTSSMSHPDYRDGWNTFEIELGGEESFDGFIAISGRAVSGSKILIDSLRYIPPLPVTEEPEESGEIIVMTGSLPLVPISDGPEEENLDDDARCPIYETIVHQCIEFNFGEEYDMLFDNTHEICTGAETWEVVKNPMSGIRPKSTDVPTCTTTPIFPVPSNGTLEVTVMIDTASFFDSVLVTMNGKSGTMYSAAYNRLVTGEPDLEYHTLSLEIKEDIQEVYNAQITFVGFATEGATILVKSFKFTPSSWDKGNCKSLLETRRQIAVGN